MTYSIQSKTNSQIKLYWWEGFQGLKPFLSRRLSGQPGFVANFGDILSPLVVNLLSQRQPKHSFGSGKLLAIGSIFFALRDHDSVWGSGLMNPKHIIFAQKAQEVKYLAVRGPRTHQLLSKAGLECPAVYGDPALLLPNLIKNDVKKKYQIGIIPHYSHYTELAHRYHGDPAIIVIDLLLPLAEIMNKLLACEIILSTSLHGLIVAEAYGIPSLMLINRQALHGDPFKFHDYFESTLRDTFYTDIDQNINLKQLGNLALKQPAPSFDPLPLLQAFPCTSEKFNLEPNSPVLSWSNFHNVNFATTKFPSLKTYAGLAKVY